MSEFKDIGLSILKKIFRPLSIIIVLTILLITSLITPASSKINYSKPLIEKRSDNTAVIVLDKSVEFIGPEAKSSIYNSFLNWVSLNNRIPKVYFEEGCCFSPSLIPDGNNVIMYTSIPFYGHEYDLAVSVNFQDESKIIYETDIIINNKYSYTIIKENDLCVGQFDLQNVMTHEAGHFFGLADNKDKQSAMNLYTPFCEVSKRELSYADIEIIERLYK